LRTDRSQSQAFLGIFFSPKLPQHPNAQLGKLDLFERIILKLRLQLRAQFERLLLASLAGWDHTPLPVNDGKFVKGSSALSLAFDKRFGNTDNLLKELPR